MPMSDKKFFDSQNFLLWNEESFLHCIAGKQMERLKNENGNAGNYFQALSLEP